MRNNNNNTTQDNMDQLRKIESLLKGVGQPSGEQIACSQFMVDMSTLGFFAGGSIVYALNDFVKKETVGDVDIFFNSKENFLEAIELIKNTFDLTKLTFSVQNFDTQNVSLVNIKVSHFVIPLQLIYKTFSDIMGLISDFDYDYTQCGIHRSVLWLTKECSEAHRARKVAFIQRGQMENQRSVKAITKGFLCPLFASPAYTLPTMTEISYEAFKTHNISAMGDVGYFSHVSPKLQGLKSVDALRIIGFHFDAFVFHHTHLGKFLIDCDGIRMYKTSVSIEIDIAATDGVNVMVKNGPVKDIFDKIDVKLDDLDGPKLALNKNIVVIRAFRCGNNFVARITAVSNAATIAPIKFIDMFTVDGVDCTPIKVYLEENNAAALVRMELNKLIGSTRTKGIVYCKINAYRCFLHNINEWNDELNAVVHAYGQFWCDFRNLGLHCDDKSSDILRTATELIHYFKSI